MQTFDDLLDAVASWAEKQERLILRKGNMLTSHQVEIAKRVGVQIPEKVRVLVVPEIPFPEDPILRAMASDVGMFAESVAGMTFGYGMFIRSDQAGTKSLWPHELRHVAQYECFGTVKAFMFAYLKELLHFRYGPGPLEVDATAAERA